MEEYTTGHQPAVAGGGIEVRLREPVSGVGAPWWAIDENTRGYGRRKPYYHFSSATDGSGGSNGGNGGDGCRSGSGNGGVRATGDHGTESSSRDGGGWEGQDGGRSWGCGGHIREVGWSSYARLPYNVFDVALWSNPVTVVAAQLTGKIGDVGRGGGNTWGDEPRVASGSGALNPNLETLKLIA
jgi:hypothetical protein